MTTSRTAHERAFIVIECQRETCGLRLPIIEGERCSDRCPRCGGPARVATTSTFGTAAPISWPAPLSWTLYALVDNVRSIFNVGSILRICDGVGVSQTYLCGITPTPDNPKVAKTALGAETTVRWSYHPNALQVAGEMRERGVSLLALEAVPGSDPLVSVMGVCDSGAIALVVGNELTGIDPELMSLCDRTVHIPMAGSKSSLNVAVAFGIAAYWLRASAGAPARGGPECD